MGTMEQNERLKSKFKLVSTLKKKKNRLFFRAVLDSQQNLGKDWDISHNPTPTHA